MTIPTLPRVAPIRGATLLLALSVTACGGGDDPVPPSSLPPVDLVVSTAARAAAPISVAGTVIASEEARISTRTSGTVQAVEVDVGDRVRTGDALVRLETADAQARLEAAEADQRLATATFGRIRALAADGAASRQELDEARSRLERADASVAEARAHIAWAMVRAPFDGTIERRHVDPGDLAVPGAPLLTLVTTASPRIVFELPSDQATSVTEGGAATLTDPATGRTARLRVTRVAPALDPGTRRLRVEADLVDPAEGPFRPGTFVRVSLASRAGSTLWIPTDAVVRRGQLTGVFSVESDTVRLRWIRLGREAAGAIELLAGPADSITVVRSPDPGLRDGAPVGSIQMRAWSPTLGGTR